jgi:TolB protein
MTLTLVIASIATSQVAADEHRPNERITFQRFDADGHWQIWVADPDLSHQQQITSGPSNSGFPTWSPDGTRIAFQSDRTDPDPNDDVEIQDIFTMRSDGSDLQKITDTIGDNEKPDWSPDGRWLIFVSDRADYPTSLGLYRIRSDGSGGLTRLTHLPAGSEWQELARYSPDGKWIEYTEYRLPSPTNPDPYTDESALIIARADGSDPRRITPWSISAADADWSPDGRRLVFAPRLARDEYVQSVMVVDVDGRHLQELTSGDQLTGDGDATRYQESFNPVWSPDGTRIMFVRASYTASDGFTQGLMTMRADGSHPAFVSDVHGQEHQPEWWGAHPSR